ncbi:MAG: hypothetical protein AUK35_07420 [Zetaproteobacteria bacterium CG2_30_46_52]|nr:MAG: hypothetical protein AUK35_07420 [Zetaproteobacteria bacterium CG2_30_46_52]
MRVYIFLLVLLLVSCTDAYKDEITQLLDSRDLSISARDINSYKALLSAPYIAAEGAEAVAQMDQLFIRFEKVEMRTQHREIRLINDNEALCEQTYSLKVFADGQWRDMVQREQIKLTRSEAGWRIGGGL